MLGKMSLHGLGHVLAFDELNQTDLRGFITIFGGALDLRDHARPRLQYGDRVNVTLVVVNLGHADFFSEYSVNHYVVSSSFPLDRQHFSCLARRRNCRAPGCWLLATSS